MNFIISGGLGHIGSKLTIQLAKEFKSSRILVIDSLLTQRYPSLFNYKKYKNIYFLQKDLSKQSIDKYMNKNSIIINLAAITDAASSFENANLVEKNNFEILKRIAKSATSKKSKLIHISSTSVYGTQKNFVDESCEINDLKPQSPYAESKLKEERHLEKTSGLNYICFRFGTIYGFSTGMRFHTAVNKFCWQAANNEMLSIWKTAYKQKRPYLDLKDACRAIIFIIKKKHFNNEIYNVLSDNLTVENVVTEIKNYYPNLKINFVKNKIMNQLSYEVSNTKFRSLGFRFNGKLNKAIKETLANLPDSNF